MIDCHMHTPLCGHSRGEPEEFVASAVARRLEGIIVTCHVPMEIREFNPNGKTRMLRSQLEEYRQWVTRARVAGEQSGIEVRYGIEAEIFPDDSQLGVMKEILSSEPFDFVLGSLHHQLPGYRDWVKKNGATSPADIVRFYFKHLKEGFATGLYDSIAHPDVIQIYGTVPPFDPRDFKEEICAVLDTVKQNNGCIEINTSGLHKGIYQYHPGPVILRWAAERKVDLTLGSDSHAPHYVGYYFSQLLPFLRDLGYKEVFSFKKRQKQAHSIL